MTLILGLLAVAIIPTNPDHYRYQTTVALVFGAWLLAGFVRARLDASAAVAFFLVVVLGVTSVYWRSSPFAGFGPHGFLLMNNAVLEALGFFLLITLPVLVLNNVRLAKLLDGFALLGLIDSAWVLYRFCTGELLVHGMLDASSIDSWFIALVYPIMVFRPVARPYDSTNLRSVRQNWRAALMDTATVVLPPLAILATRSSTGFGVLVAVLGAQLYASGYPIKRLAVVAGAAALPVVFLGFLVMGHKLFDGSGRLTMLQEAFAYWRVNADVWWGAGLGTFNALGPAVVKSQPVIWLHNDWAQVLFELGAVGLAVAVGFFFRLIPLAFRREPWLFACLIGYGFSAALQMPLRHGLTALLGAALVARTFSHDN